MGVQIVMRWGDAVVAARDIGAGKGVWIGEGEAGSPVDFTVPADKLGVRRAPLVLGAAPGERGPRAVIVPGAKLAVTRAAEELSLAQPTVSCLIRKLADTLGGPVLEAQGRRMEPTALGRELLVLCDEMFDSVERFAERRAALLESSEPAGSPAPVAEVSSGA